MTRRLLIIGTLLLAFAAPVVPAPAALADSQSCPSFAQGDYSQDDVNGDAISDVVVGVPRASPSAGEPGAGVVDVHYPGPASTSPATQRFGESFFGDTPAAHDSFGTSVALTHFGTGSTCADLAIGAPGADAGTGAVTFAQGSPDGISAAGSFRVAGSHPGDRFGAAVVAGDEFVYVAAPDEMVAGHPGAGAVYEYRVDGEHATLVTTFTEDTPGVPGIAENDDHFGQNLATIAANELLVGEPGEDVGRAVDAGSVTLLTLRPGTAGTLATATALSQNSPGVPGVAEAGDHFGASVSFGNRYLLVGVPDEDLGRIRNAGAVQVFSFGPEGVLSPLQTVSQESPTIPGESEAGDRFGAAVELNDSYFDTRLTYGISIGVPGESLGQVRAAGDVLTATITVRGLRFDGPPIRMGGDYPDLVGPAQAGAHVGAALSMYSRGYDVDGDGGGDTVVVAVPAIDTGGVNTGEVWVGDDAPGFTGHGLYRDSAGSTPDEFYGVPAQTTSAYNYD